jgi:hypothetical protein
MNRIWDLITWQHIINIILIVVFLVALFNFRIEGGNRFVDLKLNSIVIYNQVFHLIHKTFVSIIYND